MFPLNIVLAALCASVAFGVSMMFERGAVFDTLGMRRRAVNCWIVGLLFAGANIMFDYSSAAAVREAVSVAASNLNNVSDTRKSEVKRIEERISDIKRQTSWATVFQAPDAYQAEIDNLMSDGIIVKRSKGCTDQTLPDTRAHCAKIATAKAHLAMAQDRQKLSKEMAQLDIDLIKAKDNSVSSKTHANPAMAQVRAISAWFTGERSLNETTSFWGGNSIMLLMTILVNAGMIYLGNEIGHSRGENIARERGIDPHAQQFTFTAPRLEGPTAAREPVPLKPIDSNRVVINGQTQSNSSETEALLAMAREALERYSRNSPFSTDGGRA